jgi:hypothetical protein
MKPGSIDRDMQLGARFRHFSIVKERQGSGNESNYDLFQAEVWLRAWSGR